MLSGEYIACSKQAASKQEIQNRGGNENPGGQSSRITASRAQIVAIKSPPRVRSRVWSDFAGWNAAVMIQCLVCYMSIIRRRRLD